MKTPFLAPEANLRFWRVCRVVSCAMTEDEIEALVEARVLAVRAGWQRQAKEKIAEALAAGIAEGLQRGAEGPQRGAEGRHVNVDGDKKLRYIALVYFTIRKSSHDGIARRCLLHVAGLK